MAKQKQARIIPRSDAQMAAVEDQIRDRQKEIGYDLRDFTIEFLVQKFRAGSFFVPEYQRAFVWNDKNKTRFIESVVLGLPIPFMFVADMQNGDLEIVDGAQRIQTLEAFFDNQFALKDLEELPTLNGFRFDDLPVAQQKKLANRALRIIVLNDQTSMELRKEIFSRINTSGKPARGAEVRRGAFQGSFMTFVKDLAEDPEFLRLCPVSPQALKHRENEELVIRFFAYSEDYQKFRHDVEAFLDEFVKRHREHFNRAKMESEFRAMLTFVSRNFPAGFAKARNSVTTPRVRFEAIAVGTNLALRIEPDLAPRSMGWLDGESFKVHTTTHASNSGKRIRERIEFVRDELLGRQP